MGWRLVGGQTRDLRVGSFYNGAGSNLRIDEAPPSRLAEWGQQNAKLETRLKEFLEDLKISCHLDFQDQDLKRICAGPLCEPKPRQAVLPYAEMGLGFGQSLSRSGARSQAIHRGVSSFDLDFSMYRSDRLGLGLSLGFDTADLNKGNFAQAATALGSGDL